MTAREELNAAIAALDEEAFGWLALACLQSAMLHQARTQIWPDGTGGFRDGAGIEKVRALAKRYAVEVLNFPADTLEQKHNGD